MNSKQSGRSLQAESLENRAMLAGDVTASIEGGILFLRGDETANNIVISNAGGNIQVTGVNTTVNGNASFTSEGTLRGVTVQTGDGNDTVRFANETGPVVIPGAVVVNTGMGADVVSGRIRNEGAVAINTGASADRIALNGSQLGTLVVNTDPFGTQTGPSGNDQVTLTNVRAVRGAAIRTGAGDDAVRITGNSAFPATLTVSTDAGNDTVNIQGAAGAAINVGGALTVNSGRGNDRVNIAHVNVQGAATVTNFDGEANVTINALVARDGLFASLGGGSDALSITNSRGRIAVLIGGLGIDTLSTADNAFDEVIRVSF